MAVEHNKRDDTWRVRIRRRGEPDLTLRNFDPKHPASYATEAEAQEGDELLRRLVAEEREQKSTLDAYIENWLSDPEYAKQHGWEESTIETYRQSLTLFRREYGHRQVDGLERVDFARINRAYPRWRVAPIKNLYRDLAGEDRVPAVDPFYGLRAPRPKDVRENLSRPSEAEVMRMLDRAHDLSGPGYHAWLSAAVWSASRPGELDMWEWDNLDLENNRYWIEWNWSPKIGKAKAPKNGQHRYAIVPDPLAELLASHPREGRYCFLNSRGNHWSESSRSSHWTRLRVAMDWPPEMRCYDATRHWLATFLVETVGLTENEASLVIGQTDGGKTLKRHYLHAEAERAQGLALERMRTRGRVIDLDARRKRSG